MEHVRSLGNKMDKLSRLIKIQREYHKCSTLCFTETWLHSHFLDHSKALPGFRTVQADRDIIRSGKKKGGWVALSQLHSQPSQPSSAEVASEPADPTPALAPPVTTASPPPVASTDRVAHYSTIGTRRCRMPQEAIIRRLGDLPWAEPPCSCPPAQIILMEQLPSSQTERPLPTHTHSKTPLFLFRLIPSHHLLHQHPLQSSTSSNSFTRPISPFQGRRSFPGMQSTSYGTIGDEGEDSQDEEDPADFWCMVVEASSYSGIHGPNFGTTLTRDCCVGGKQDVLQFGPAEFQGISGWSSLMQTKSPAELPLAEYMAPTTQRPAHELGAVPWVKKHSAPSPHSQTHLPISPEGRRPQLQAPATKLSAHDAGHVFAAGSTPHHVNPAPGVDGTCGQQHGWCHGQYSPPFGLANLSIYSDDCVDGKPEVLLGKIKAPVKSITLGN
eukprot:superscaffoldBa00000996_g8429